MLAIAALIDRAEKEKAAAASQISIGDVVRRAESGEGRGSREDAGGAVLAAEGNGQHELEALVVPRGAPAQLGRG